ncbi:ABC transporter permease [Candidatus Saccharibacteria bacterium]|nr:ABC transporter permease [Candidatus Saccharibacteria bacterium]
MALLFRTHLRLARTSIRENRTRSFLTCLGIAIGIASIILILSLTGSISRLISNEVYDIGTDLIVVRPSTTKDEVTTIIEELTTANSFQTSNLSLGDVTTIKGLSAVTAAAPIATTSNTITVDDNTIPSATILGTTPDFIKIEPLAISTGAFLSNKNPDTSIVLGHSISIDLFNTPNSVGKTIEFYGKRFIVVGVLEHIEETINFDNIDFDHTIFMNMSALSEAIPSAQIQQINVKVDSTDTLSAIAESIEAALTINNSGDTNFTVSYGGQIAHPASSLLNIVTGMLTLVAGISLVVGGIGVMNIMLVSVAERTHEIGIRKAVGASSYNILMQFILESLILSISGGFLGILLGYTFAFLISIITPFTPYISWEAIAITFLTTVAIGLIFGVYPALKAAYKRPIDSLRHFR